MIVFLLIEFAQGLDCKEERELTRLSKSMSEVEGVFEAVSASLELVLAIDDVLLAREGAYGGFRHREFLVPSLLQALECDTILEGEASA